MNSWDCQSKFWSISLSKVMKDLKMETRMRDRFILVIFLFVMLTSVLKRKSNIVFEVGEEVCRALVGNKDFPNGIGEVDSDGLTFS